MKPQNMNFAKLIVIFSLLLSTSLSLAAEGKKPKLNVPPKGFRALFNGKDLTGWQGVLKNSYDNPVKRNQLGQEDYAKRQAQANERMVKHWKVKNGVLEFDGKGFSLATDRDYTDFEMQVDWKLLYPKGDSGIYLRGSPQVQIWDPEQHKVGSGGLFNNKINPDKPLVTADKPIGQWNNFRIRMPFGFLHNLP